MRAIEGAMLDETAAEAAGDVRWRAAETAEAALEEAAAAGPGSAASLAVARLQALREWLEGRVVFLIGDSIAHELGIHMLRAEGLEAHEVRTIAKPGAAPVDILVHLNKWLAADEGHLQQLRAAGLLVLCAGKNLARYTPSIIGSEVSRRHASAQAEILCRDPLQILARACIRRSLVEIACVCAAWHR